MKKYFLIFGLAFLSQPLFAGDPTSGGTPSGPGKFQTSAMAMVLTSSTKQGGQGPSGSTILTHTNIQYNKDWYGVGLYFQYDKHGGNETDTGVGPKIELNYHPFYFEAGYTFMVDRAYTDRSIAKESGNGLLLGFGVRFALGGTPGGGGGTPGGGGVFFEASYKYRTQKLIKQDGVTLSESISQSDGYPVFGLGYKF